MVTVVWETYLKGGAEREGLAVTRRIWSEMPGFEGYVSHNLLVDQDDRKHLLVVSRWRDREYADRALRDYAGAEPVKLIAPLVARPRNRWVFSDEDVYSA